MDVSKMEETDIKPWDSGATSSEIKGIHPRDMPTGYNMRAAVQRATNLQQFVVCVIVWCPENWMISSFSPLLNDNFGGYSPFLDTRPENGMNSYEFLLAAAILVESWLTEDSLNIHPSWTRRC